MKKRQKQNNNKTHPSSSETRPYSRSSPVCKSRWTVPSCPWPLTLVFYPVAWSWGRWGARGHIHGLGRMMLCLFISSSKNHPIINIYSRKYSGQSRVREISPLSFHSYSTFPLLFYFYRHFINFLPFSNCLQPSRFHLFSSPLLIGSSTVAV